MPLRVMTWNIHGMRGSDRRLDPDRVARVLEEVGADVVGLQEVGVLSGPESLEDQALLLASRTGLSAVFGPTLERGARRYGNCLLTRYPIGATRSYDLSVPRREPRGCLRADVIVGEWSVHVFNCHLGLHWRERRRQASQLLSADILRDAALSHPLVLVGDFNAWSNRSAVPTWLRRQLTDCAAERRSEGPTFPAHFPLLRLDRIYVDAALAVSDCRVHDSALAREASDHLPVVADLELTAEARTPPPARPLTAAGVVTELRGADGAA